MGFRSNLITEDLYEDIPKWFTDKYDNYVYSVNRDGNKTLAFAQLYESKFYSAFNEDERFLDIQKMLKEINLDSLVVILLHECGGITKIIVKQNSIKAKEPVDWKEVDCVTHYYCYGCSD